MTKPFHISLKAGERIYVNGAVLRVDRKVSLEFLNEVTFLLESHVLQPEQTTTPLRQLYFIVQSMLVEPTSAAMAHELFRTSVARLKGMFRRDEILDMLETVEALVAEDRAFEALKRIRSMFGVEAEVLGGVSPSQPGRLAQHVEVA